MSSVAQGLRERIRSGGPIPFAEVMAEALYGDSGYYRSKALPIGPQGDFITGASISPLFGRATAELIRRLDRELGRPADILEVGYGNGFHLCSVLEDLAEVSGRRVLAVDRVGRPLPLTVEVLGDLADLDGVRLEGLIFSYELFDALPIHRLIGRQDGDVGELWVELSPDQTFQYVEGDLSDPLLRDCLGSSAADLAPGQIADLAPGWSPMYRQLASLLGAGFLVTCDYGYERHRLLDRRVRPHGTLACHQRQRVHRDALSDLGDQDLTAHVDFTALREVGEEDGLETLAFTRQARWLLACGLFDQIQTADQTARLEAMDLLNPAGMGEEIRVLVQSREVDAPALLDLELLNS